MGERDYSSVTVAALFAVSVKCYYPNCPVTSVNIFDGEGEGKNVQIAHIYGARPGGPRYDSRLTKDQRKSFQNLILLCDLHHNLVDKRQPEEYTPSILLSWKQANENSVRAKMKGLDKLSEDRLEEMLTNAARDAKNEIKSALDELNDNSEDAARLLRELYYKIERHYLDYESIALLDAASRRLYFLEEGSGLIHAASHRLGNLEENAGMLARAADKIDVDTLSVASQRLNEFTENYSRILSDPPDFPDVSKDIEAATRSLISEIDERVDLINNSSPPTLIDDEQRWRFAAWGFVAGVSMVLIIVIILLVLVLNGNI